MLQPKIHQKFINMLIEDHITQAYQVNHCNYYKNIAANTKPLRE